MYYRGGLERIAKMSDFYLAQVGHVFTEGVCVSILAMLFWVVAVSSIVGVLAIVGGLYLLARRWRWL